jgi:hypothetical protein
MPQPKTLWWFRRPDGRERPGSFEELSGLVLAGELQGTTPVRRDDWRQWVLLSSIPEFQAVLSRAPGQRPPGGEATVPAAIAVASPVDDQEIVTAETVALPSTSSPASDPVPFAATVPDRPSADAWGLPPGENAEEWVGQLPPELEDPMRDIARRFGWYLLWMLVVLLALSMFVLTVWSVLRDSPVTALLGSGLYMVWILFFVYWSNLIWWRAFAPRRPTDVFYLRSFQNDQDSWPIRVAVQEALGERYRLSGIRDPRRRTDGMQDRFSPWLKAMRHCTPKFMDLEAGDDWQARLWRSLQKGRLALVDLTVATPFVRQEIRLVSQAIGWERTVILGTAPQTEDEIRRLVAAEVGDVPAAGAQVLIWPDVSDSTVRSSAIRDFQRRFRQMFEQIVTLPPVLETPPPPPYAKRGRQAGDVPMSRSMIRWMVGFQVVLLVIQVGLTLVARLSTADPDWQSTLVMIGSLPFWLANSVLFIFNFGMYIYNVGIFRRRLKACALMLLMLGVAAATFWQVRATVQVPPDTRLRLSEIERRADAALRLAEERAMGTGRGQGDGP